MMPHVTNYRIYTPQLQQILIECLLLMILLTSLLEKQITALACWYQNNRGGQHVLNARLLWPAANFLTFAGWKVRHFGIVDIGVLVCDTVWNLVRTFGFRIRLGIF